MKVGAIAILILLISPAIFCQEFEHESKEDHDHNEPVDQDFNGDTRSRSPRNVNVKDDSRSMAKAKDTVDDAVGLSAGIIALIVIGVIAFCTTTICCIICCLPCSACCVLPACVAC